MRSSRVLPLVAVALSLASCSSRVPDLEGSGTTSPSPSVVEPGSTSSTTSTSAPVTSTTETLVFVPAELHGLATTPISIVDGDITHVLTVVVADTPETRAQGLMNVSDLGDIDGMLFVWDAPTVSAFWMKDTVLPLDIAFFGADFAFVDSFAMLPCTEDPCPSYPAAAAFSYAVEVPATGFAALTPGARLVLEE